jgi:hypothetical protein
MERQRALRGLTTTTTNNNNNNNNAIANANAPMYALQLTQSSTHASNQSSSSSLFSQSKHPNNTNITSFVAANASLNNPMDASSSVDLVKRHSFGKKTSDVRVLPKDLERKSLLLLHAISQLPLSPTGSPTCASGSNRTASSSSSLSSSSLSWQQVREEAMSSNAAVGNNKRISDNLSNVGNAGNVDNFGNFGNPHSVSVVSPSLFVGSGPPHISNLRVGNESSNYVSSGRNAGNNNHDFSAVSQKSAVNPSSPKSPTGMDQLSPLSPAYIRPTLMWMHDSNASQHPSQSLHRQLEQPQLQPQNRHQLPLQHLASSSSAAAAAASAMKQTVIQEAREDICYCNECIVHLKQMINHAC